MVLKKIITRNIQNHAEVVVDLPETGMVVFTGNNSNGKSVIVKVTRALITNGIRRPRTRASLVNRKAMFGEAIYVRSDDVVLTLHLAREANATYVKYEVPGQEPIVRYLADKTYTELVKAFGWHYDENSDISLNIAEEEDSLLFYKTSHKINASIIQTATSDSTAEVVATNFENTLKQARSFRENYTQQVRTYKSALNELQVFDEEELTKKHDRLNYLLHNLSTVYLPDIPEIKGVPVVHFVDVYTPQLPKIKYPRIVTVDCIIPDITAVAKELKVLHEHKCPTCGRGFDCDC